MSNNQNQAAQAATQGASIEAAPLDSYSPEDRAFYKFWYGHMDGDLMRAPLSDVSHSTARYIWDAARCTPAAAVGAGELLSLEHVIELIDDSSYEDPETGRGCFDRLGFARAVERAAIAADRAQRQAPATVTAPAKPVELAGVAEEIAEGSGFWRECSGCYDTEDGRPTQDYAYSHVFGCALGNGCSECGGIGAVWDNTDYKEMARGWDEDAAPAAQQAAPSDLACKACKGFGKLLDLSRCAVCKGTGQHHGPATAGMVEDAKDAAIEARAKEIYAGYVFADRYPWVEGGNSIRQDDARAEARAELAAQQAQASAKDKSLDPNQVQTVSDRIRNTRGLPVAKECESNHAEKSFPCSCAKEGGAMGDDLKGEAA